MVLTPINQAVAEDGTQRAKNQEKEVKELAEFKQVSKNLCKKQVF